MSTPNKKPHLDDVASQAYESLSGARPSRTKWAQAWNQVKAINDASTNCTDIKTTVVLERVRFNACKVQADQATHAANEKEFHTYVTKLLCKAGIQDLDSISWGVRLLTFAYALVAGDHKKSDVSSGVALEKMSKNATIGTEMLQIVKDATARYAIFSNAVQKEFPSLSPYAVQWLMQKAKLRFVYAVDFHILTGEEATVVVQVLMAQHHEDACIVDKRHEKQHGIDTRKACIADKKHEKHIAKEIKQKKTNLLWNAKT